MSLIRCLEVLDSALLFVGLTTINIAGASLPVVYEWLHCVPPKVWFVGVCCSGDQQGAMLRAEHLHTTIAAKFPLFLQPPNMAEHMCAGELICCLLFVVLTTIYIASASLPVVYELSKCATKICHRWCLPASGG